MTYISTDEPGNFRLTPQHRKKGSGKGRKCFRWKDNLPWLVIATDLLCCKQAGGSDAILEYRDWVGRWQITPEWIRLRLEEIFPGVSVHVAEVKPSPSRWKDLKNRVYKMYYYGTSAGNLNPDTRATRSPEHWHNWVCRLDWEYRLKMMVHRTLRVKHWRRWVC